MYTEESPMSASGDAKQEPWELIFSQQCADEPHSVYSGVHEQCPVHRTLTNEIEIRTDLLP